MQSLFRDELGDWRVCLLTPFGARVHAPWALAIEARLQSSLGVDVKPLWSDDGIVLSSRPHGETNAIVELLTKAIAEINTDNTDFADKLFQQSDRMEQITQLEDIRSIKGQKMLPKNGIAGLAANLLEQGQTLALVGDQFGALVELSDAVGEEDRIVGEHEQLRAGRAQRGGIERMAVDDRSDIRSGPVDLGVHDRLEVVVG